MTVRGGGVPTCFLGFNAEMENGSAASTTLFAALHEPVTGTLETSWDAQSSVAMKGKADVARGTQELARFRGSSTRAFGAGYVEHDGAMPGLATIIA